MAAKGVADSHPREVYIGANIATVETFQIPSSSVGLIIGRKGQRLRKIEEETRVKIKIWPLKTMHEVHVVRIRGLQCNCEAAKQQIVAIVDSLKKRKPHSQSEYSLVDQGLKPKEPLSAWQSEVSSQETVLQVEVPSRSLGLIIGTKGRQMRKIEEESQLQKSAINVSRYESKPGMQIVSIKGTLHSCETAKQKIEELVKLSRESEAHSRGKAGRSAVAGRTNKYLSFITFLEDTDEIVFQSYSGIPPLVWKGKRSDIYFLEACQQKTEIPLEEMHRRLRNYSRLEDSLGAVMEESFGSAPGYLELEARFGKVLWTSDGRRSVSDEVLGERHKIRDLEKGGNVSVEDVLGGNDTRWCFQTILSDTTVLDLMKDNPDKFPVIGDVRQLDITVQDSSSQQYLIRFKQSREKCEETFQLLEFLLRPDKPYVFDCLNLERDLDVRIAVSCSPHNTDAQGVTRMREVAEEMCRGMSFRDGCLYVKEPPGEYTIDYARWADHTMYLVSHQDKEHGEYQYILAHYQVEDSQHINECSLSPGVEGKEVVLKFGDKHDEVELWNCQWMVDFAALCGKTPEEVFTLISCDPSKIKVRPKDKDKVNAASVIRELEPFVACALQLAVIDRD